MPRCRHELRNTCRRPARSRQRITDSSPMDDTAKSPGRGTWLSWPTNSHARAGAAPEELACNQQPGNRFFWLERAFCDLPTNGPERANGVIIWNHGISGTTQSWMAPAPPAFRLLQARGWDVIMLKRHHAAEGDNALYRTVQRTLDEAKAFRKAGYRKVVLAGQS